MQSQKPIKGSCRSSRLLAPEKVTFNWKNVTANQSKLHEASSRILSLSYLMPQQQQQQQQALFTFRFRIIIVTEGSFSLTVSYMQRNKRKTKYTLQVRKCLASK